MIFTHLFSLDRHTTPTSFPLHAEQSTGAWCAWDSCASECYLTGGNVRSELSLGGGCGRIIGRSLITVSIQYVADIAICSSQHTLNMQWRVRGN